MRPFAYERPTRLADAVALLDEHGPDARPLAGGTDLIIRLRDGSIAPRLVIDVKRIAELDDTIREVDGTLRIGARTVMTDIARTNASGGTSRPSPRRPRSSGPPRSATARRWRATSATPPRRPTRRRRSSSTAPASSWPDRPARGRSRSTTSSSGPASRPSSAASSCWRSNCRCRRARGDRSTSAAPAVAVTTSRR